MPTPASLSEVFDAFVLDTSLVHDSTMMEAAGAQCLLLAGFFEDQMRARHQSGGTPSSAPAFTIAPPRTNGHRKRRGCWMRSPAGSSRGGSATRN